ncbi:MAG: RNA polymerase factor sigma-54, partial [Planctomycetota bacterium]
MRLEASLQARQEMRLKLAPQIIQSIEILQLPLLELRDRIDQELLENPLLEVSSADEEQGEQEATAAEVDEEMGPVEEPGEEPETEADPQEEENYEAVEDIIRQAEDEADWRTPRRSYSGEEDGKRAAIENSPAPDISLEEHLRRQLAYFDIDPVIHAICENIVANLDWRGYLEYPLEEIGASMNGQPTPEQAQEALDIVQRLEPPGIGARGIEECLILQLDPRGPDYDFLKRLIEGHFEDVLKNRYPKVARAMDCSIERLKEAVEEIGRLNPIPGALFGEEGAPHVMPDLRVELVDGQYRVMLEDASLPSLRIAGYYARQLQQKDLDPKTEEYLRKKLQSARWLIDAIQQRRSTLYNITSAIVETQREFLGKGPMHLKPLKMQDVADEVGVHVSTVSRAMAGKYIQTPRGIYSLKHFFTGGVEKEDGEMESWEVVRQKLQQVIDGEDKSNPLSDEQIA